MAEINQQLTPEGNQPSTKQELTAEDLAAIDFSETYHLGWVVDPTAKVIPLKDILGDTDPSTVSIEQIAEYRSRYNARHRHRGRRDTQPLDENPDAT